MNHSTLARELVKKKRFSLGGIVSENKSFCALNEYGQPLELRPFSIGEEKVAECSVYQNSVDIKVKKPLSRMKPSVSSKRDRCKGRSKKSGRRLLRECLKIMRQDLPYHVTLTYEGGNMDNWSHYSVHRDNFFRALKHRFPNFSSVWVLEFHKKNKGAHFHLLLWLDDPGKLILTPEDEWYLSTAWTRITGGGIKHLYRGVHITKPSSECTLYNERVRQYIACHQLKTNQNRTDMYTGRTWGIINEGGLLMGKKHQSILPFNFYFIIRRCMKRFLFARARQYGRLAKNDQLKSIQHLLGKAYSYFVNGDDTHRAALKAGVNHDDFMSWIEKRKAKERMKRFLKYLSSSYPVSFNITVWSFEFSKLCESIGLDLPLLREYVK